MFTRGIKRVIFKLCKPNRHLGFSVHKNNVKRANSSNDHTIVCGTSPYRQQHKCGHVFNYLYINLTINKFQNGPFKGQHTLHENSTCITFESVKLCIQH